ncbi:hypothetical protein MA16_Dca020078 [Dendrobium catenatum]|uniref:Uncharacterized protein n=1 Tax=Dendrobium catenatum TaxID=906689 RepID=A0A2I0XJL6_9ASPA|nr:hypothetical protein MA16_Dca020078 [Dendrobium catenatum]
MELHFAHFCQGNRLSPLSRVSSANTVEKKKNHIGEQCHANIGVALFTGKQIAEDWCSAGAIERSHSHV